MLPIRTLAILRASSVNLFPDNILATSSTLLPDVKETTEQKVLLSTTFFSTSTWRSANAATCGECVTASTCSFLEISKRRRPIASAVLPPTPLSISSKTIADLSFLPDKQTFSANVNLDSSPPEAI